MHFGLTESPRKATTEQSIFLDGENIMRHFTCPICLEDTKKATSSQLTCGHQFCSTCIKDWREINDSCPVCRKPGPNSNRPPAPPPPAPEPPRVLTTSRTSTASMFRGAPRRARLPTAPAYDALAHQAARAATLPGPDRDHAERTLRRRGQTALESRLSSYHTQTISGRPYEELPIVSCHELRQILGANTRALVPVLAPSSE